ncbi:MAG: hypothetical protein AAF658_08435, partial [Myxococcota bacterium]
AMSALRSAFDGTVSLALVGRRTTGPSSSRSFELLDDSGDPACEVACVGTCETSLVSTSGFFNVSELFTSDIDGDGRMDIFGQGETSSTDYLISHRGEENGACAPLPPAASVELFVPPDSDIDEADTLSEVDRDLDGDVDFAWSNYAEGMTIETTVSLAGDISLGRTLNSAVFEVTPPVISDVNRDGRQDLMGTAVGDGSALLFPGRALLGWDSFNVILAANRVVGLSEPPTLTIVPSTHPMLYTDRYPGDDENDAAAWVRAANLPELNSFGDWTFLTMPVNVDGASHIRRVATTDGSIRLAITDRLSGTDGSLGLDLEASPARGVIVSRPRRANFVGDTIATSNVVVLIRRNLWRRAAAETRDIVTDPSAQDPSWLPTVSFTRTARDGTMTTLQQPVFAPDYEWTAVPHDDGDLSTGTGREWAFEGDDVTIRTDRLGDILVLTR